MIGQVLHLKREPDNSKDKYAVAIVLEDCVASWSNHYYLWSNKGFARVTGSKVNRKAG